MASMSTSRCWRCLSRTQSISKVHVSLTDTSVWGVGTASFSTTACLSLPMPARKNPVHPNWKPPEKGKKTGVVLKKKKPVATAKPPAVGERKAMRKRIVLSNTNAVAIPDMQELNGETMLDMRLRGQVLAIPGDVIDQLRAVETFKITQGWGMFRRPGTLMRRESIEMGKTIDSLSTDGQSSTVRKVVTGERGAGKSLLLLQAQTMAFAKGWVVIAIPEAQELTIGHTEYAPLPNTSPTLYVQKTHTANLLGQIARANESVLRNLQLTQEHTLPIPVQSNIALNRLAELGARDPEIAWPVFQALWTELTSNPTDAGQKRPPILFTLDGLAHAMTETKYRNVDFEHIHAHDLALVRHFMDHLSGARHLGPSGGLVLAAASHSNNPGSKSLDLALAQLEARATRLAPDAIPLRQAYRKYDERVFEVLNGAAEVVKLQGLTKEESRGLLEYWARSGILRGTVTEQFVSEKWCLAGGGVPGELARAAVRQVGL